MRREAGSLADWQAVLCVPPGLRWVATHRPGEFDPPRRFADELTSLPLRWRHTHGFEPVGEGATRVTDHIETPIPERALRAMFANRHRQFDAGMSGPVNAVAPQPVRNADYTRILAGTLHRPAVLPVPELAPRAILGQQAASEFALASQRAHPHTLLEHGHRFRHPDLAAALAHLLGHETPPEGAQ